MRLHGLGAPATLPAGWRFRLRLARLLCMEDGEAKALQLFEAACLQDEGQFDKAMDVATERALAVPPAMLRDVLVSKGAGAAWLADDDPVLALHANSEGGCGVMMKPVEEVAWSPCPAR